MSLELAVITSVPSATHNAPTPCTHAQGTMHIETTGIGAYMQTDVQWNGVHVKRW